jgi:hypothetical protein
MTAAEDGGLSVTLRCNTNDPAALIPTLSLGRTTVGLRADCSLHISAANRNASPIGSRFCLRHGIYEAASSILVRLTWQASSMLSQRGPLIFALYRFRLFVTQFQETQRLGQNAGLASMTLRAQCLLRQKGMKV